MFAQHCGSSCVHIFYFNSTVTQFSHTEQIHTHTPESCKNVKKSFFVPSEIFYIAIASHESISDIACICWNINDTLRSWWLTYSSVLVYHIFYKNRKRFQITHRTQRTVMILFTLKFIYVNIWFLNWGGSGFGPASWQWLAHFCVDISMFSLCGFPLYALVSFYSPKTCSQVAIRNFPHVWIVVPSVLALWQICDLPRLYLASHSKSDDFDCGLPATLMDKLYK